MLSSLSVYLGSSELASTERYLRLVPDRFRPLFGAHPKTSAYPLCPACLWVSSGIVSVRGVHVGKACSLISR